MSTWLVKLLGHHHPLSLEDIVLTSSSSDCRDCCYCGEKIYLVKHYYCKDCDKLWHTGCMPESYEIDNPCHPNHTLKLLTDGPPGYSNGKCDLCREKLKEFVYHCSTCNFSLDLRCAQHPHHLRKVYESNCHNHTLTIMTRQVSFVCNVCGTVGDCSPYVCLDCSFMVHQECIDRPHVIHINRHDHRISHTCSFGPGKLVCRVCRLKIDWMYGAYSCSRCPDFVVHTKCATSKEVWDGKELLEVPEEDEDEPLMFKVIEDNVINHQMHPSHNLMLVEDGVVGEESVRCELCQDPVYSERFYSCMECDGFILHETCANLTSKKRHGLYPTRLLLTQGTNSGNIIKCTACQRYSSGAWYKNYSWSAWEGPVIDLRCAAVDWSCDHDSHPHTLYLTTLERDTCGACTNSQDYVLRCVDCKFNLCYKCATYPKKIKHRCDDHALVLCFGEEQQVGAYWCEVCEAKTDPTTWFYKCQECNVVCHIDCVLGDFSNIKPGLQTLGDGSKSGVVRNNGLKRPYCSFCTTRCLLPFIYSLSDDYFCSMACVKAFLDASDVYAYGM